MVDTASSLASRTLTQSRSGLIAPELDSSWIPIGRIVGPQGLQGDVKVYPDSDFPERFEQTGQRWLLRPGQQQPDEITLLRGRYLAQKDLYVVKLAGIDTRAQAEALQGAILLVVEGDRPSLQPGEYYLSDLVGLSVLNQQTQALIGTVVSIASAGNDLLEIQLQASPETTILVPFVEELVPIVDLNQGKIEIVPLPGLLP